MAQHDSSLEKTLQAALKHKKAGTEVATAVIAVEALISTGIAVSAIVEMSDKKLLSRCRTMVAHRAFGKRIADAVSTLDAIMQEEAIVVEVKVDENIRGTAPHKVLLRPMVIKEISQRAAGNTVSDMVEKVENVVDALLVIYGVGGAKEDADVEAALQLIKDAFVA